MERVVWRQAKRSDPFEPLMPPAWLVPKVFAVATPAGGVKH
jgi:hypothetical protein